MASSATSGLPASNSSMAMERRIWTPNQASSARSASSSARAEQPAARRRLCVPADGCLPGCRDTLPGGARRRSRRSTDTCGAHPRPSWPARPRSAGGSRHDWRAPWPRQARLADHARKRLQRRVVAQQAVPTTTGHREHRRKIHEVDCRASPVAGGIGHRDRTLEIGFSGCAVATLDRQHAEASHRVDLTSPIPFRVTDRERLSEVLLGAGEVMDHRQRTSQCAVRIGLDHRRVGNRRGMFERLDRVDGRGRHRSASTRAPHTFRPRAPRLRRHARPRCRAAATASSKSPVAPASAARRRTTSIIVRRRRPASPADAALPVVGVAPTVGRTPLRSRAAARSAKLRPPLLVHERGEPVRSVDGIVLQRTDRQRLVGGMPVVVVRLTPPPSRAACAARLPPRIPCRRSRRTRRPVHGGLAASIPAHWCRSRDGRVRDRNRARRRLR